jgi:hypothetical protein
MAVRKLSTATITKLAKERREVTAQLAELTKRKDELDAKLLSVDTSKTYEGEGIALSFTPVARLDEPTITAKFTVVEYPDYYTLKLDTAEFKKHFSPVDLVAYQKISHRINIRDL